MGPLGLHQVSAARRLWQATIWSRGAIPEEEWKYRNLKRVWLPIYDLIAVGAGIMAVLHGSLLLDRLYGDATDAIGLVFSAVALVCLLGVTFPRLWAVEVVGKVVLVGMVIAYMSAIAISPSPEQIIAKEAPNWFVVWMLAFGLPLAMFRLDMLAHERLVRKVRGALGADHASA